MGVTVVVVILEIAVETAVVKGNDIGDELVDTASSRSVKLLALVAFVKPVKTVASVDVTAVIKDRVVSSVVVERVVASAVVVVNSVVDPMLLVDPKVVETIARMVVVVILTGASVGMKGNFGQGLIIGGPSIESNT